LIAHLGGVTFDRLESCWGFLNSGDVTSALSSAVVQIDNVYLDEQDPSAIVGPLFRVLTGAGRYLRHYSFGKKAAPNAIIRVDTAQRANDALLTLVASRRNKAGIAPGAAILIDFGPSYDHDLATKQSSEPSSKRMKYMLERYFRAAEQPAEEERAPGGDADNSGQADSPLPPDVPKPEDPNPDVPKPHALRDGEVVVGEVSGELTGVVFFKKGNALGHQPIVGFSTQARETNKKLKPLTAVALLDAAGEIQHILNKTVGVPYAFTKTKGSHVAVGGKDKPLVVQSIWDSWVPLPLGFASTSLRNTSMITSPAAGGRQGGTAGC
jgi:hypothetical protein